MLVRPVTKPGLLTLPTWHPLALTWMTRVRGSPGWCLIHFSLFAVENCGSGR